MVEAWRKPAWLRGKYNTKNVGKTLSFLSLNQDIRYIMPKKVTGFWSPRASPQTRA